jgi:type IV pilus assembly protein PilY1
MSITPLFRPVILGLALLLVAVPARPDVQQIAQSPPGITPTVSPNVLFALSVEYPTAGTAFPNVPTFDASQLSRLFAGYFDPNKCYDYNAVGGYFYPVAAVNDSTSRTCANQKWSCNLLNWATMSAIDVFRSTLSGGNRALGVAGLCTDYLGGDLPGFTTLRRARVYAGQNSGSGFANRKLTTSVNKLTKYSSATSVSFTSNDWSFTVTPSGGGSSTAETFNAIVKVCDPAVALEANCKAYPGPLGAVNYKPEGLIQQNGATIRFGAFGYLNDPDYNRDGWVMRARLKFTNSSGQVTTLSGKAVNLGGEWNPSDGTFVTNPDPADALAGALPVTNSGVINYLNKFGDANGYKVYDPAAELYYAALRYYRKLCNYAPYSARLTPAMVDGFPVITDWDDPIVNACQKNFILYIGDTNTHGDVDLPGSRWKVPNGSGNTRQATVRPPSDDTAFNIAYQVTTIGKDAGVSNLASINTGSTNSPPYIAGLAYWANTTNLRPDLPGMQTVQSFMIDVVENNNPKTQTSNAFYLAAKYGGFKSSTVTTLPTVRSDWTDDPAGQTSIAAYPNGVPRNFAQANNPQNMAGALTGALKQILNGTNLTLATPAANGSAVRPDGTSLLFRPTFNPNNWTGDVQAYRLDQNGVLATTYSWSAAAQLESQLGGSAAGRQLYTFNPAVHSASAFDASQSWLVTRLNQNEAGTPDSYGPQRINYVRGDQSQEAKAGQTAPVPAFRGRTQRFGDVIGSAPLYLPPPGQAGAGFQPPECGFNSNNLAAIKARAPMLAVGANDGVLHVLDAGSGKELFGYVPGSLLGALPQLMGLSYAKNHRYFVDGAVQAANVCLPVTGGSEARTVLVGHTGAGATASGGSSVLALDVTMASASGGGFNAGNVLWEFSDADDNHFGRSVLQPQIAKVRSGSGYRYAALKACAAGERCATDGHDFRCVKEPRR